MGKQAKIQALPNELMLMIYDNISFDQTVRDKKHYPVLEKLVDNKYKEQFEIYEKKIKLYKTEPTFLEYACASGDINSIDWYFKKHNEELIEYDYYSKAAEHGQIKVIKWLIKNYKRVCLLDAFTGALCRKQYECFKFMFSKFKYIYVFRDIDEFTYDEDYDDIFDGEEDPNVVEFLEDEQRLLNAIFNYTDFEFMKWALENMNLDLSRAMNTAIYFKKIDVIKYMRNTLRMNMNQTSALNKAVKSRELEIVKLIATKSSQKKILSAIKYASDIFEEEIEEYLESLIEDRRI